MKKISILISKNCFGKCEGCYLDPREGKELTLTDIGKIANELKDFEYEGVTLSGGDPLLREDIFEIIEIFHSRNFDIHLDTTGDPLLEESFRNNFIKNNCAKKISLIGRPVDGSSEDIMKKFRTNWNGIEKKTFKVLDILEELGCRVAINTVVHKGNIDDLKNIHDRLIEYSCIQRWELHQFVSLSEKAQFLKDQYEITEIEFTEGFQEIPENSDIEISPKVSSRKRNFKYIDFNGDIIEIKDGIKKILGNVKTDRILNFY